MKTTRRSLFAWLGALTGAAAVSRVAAAEAAPKTLPALRESSRGWGGVEDVLRAEGSLFVQPCPLHWTDVGCDLDAGHIPYSYVGTDGKRHSCNGLVGQISDEPHDARAYSLNDAVESVRRNSQLPSHRGTHDVYPRISASGTVEHVKIPRTIAGRIELYAALTRDPEDT